MFFRRVGKGQEKFICATENFSEMLYIVTENNKKILLLLAAHETNKKETHRNSSLNLY